MQMEQKSNIFLTDEQDTIIALCSPRGSGAIALLRLSGQNSVQIADKIANLSSKKKLHDANTHTIHHGYVVSDSKKIIDEVLFFLMHGPKTFTGQNTVEIGCHNNPFIIEQIIEQAIIAGARQAKPGEFTKRAFLNGKVDLIQAESINDVIHAQTELALRKSMSQLQGSLSHCLQEIEEELVGILSVTESSFEFLEEEQRDLGFDNLLIEKLNLLLNKLIEIKINFNQQQQIKQGIKIGIIGKVNAGKSTLFNSLLKKDRAIVTDIAGTTRDSIESSLYRNGNFWLLTDTAGLRQTEDFIEQEGINRSWRQAAESDIILLVLDASQVLSDQEVKVCKEIIAKYKDKIIIIANKIDIEDKDVLSQLDFDTEQLVKVSAEKQRGIDLVEEKIEHKIQKLFSKLQSPFLLNKRQYNLVVQLEQKLDFVVKTFKNNIEYELIAYHLKEMLEDLSELTGRNVTEKVLDRVFRDFCVGK